MPENVVYLHPQPEPIAHYLRLGAFHRQAEKLLAAGRLPVERVMVEASAFAHQKDVAGQLVDAGRELILDTNVAELSAVGRYGGAAKSAPWAHPEGPLQPEHFARGSNHDVIGMIARFAVEHKFHAVQAPAHLLESSADAWFGIDRQACDDLRSALDAAGGNAIAIDYSLTLKYGSLRDPAQRRVLIAGLKDLPFDNLWLRVSGFGADAEAPMLRRFIAAAVDFQQLDRPIVADGVGGLAAVAVAAFGAAGGISHGLGEKERFAAGDWNKPPVPRAGGGGREKRLLMPGLDRLLSVKQVELLMAADGGRRLLGCQDRTCCPNGHNDTLKDPKGHYLRQRAKPLERLSRVPEARRIDDFLRHDLDPAARIAETATKLNLADAETTEMLRRTNERLGRLGPVLRDLHVTMGDRPHAHSPKRRVNLMADARTARR
ncbi:hypothetical protein [Phenylobacterium sp.]|uniref:hypothetical protein n=1 Tax=Phenylobacterium sp. TaxID=1871053 RepID=UPI002F418C8F